MGNYPSGGQWSSMARAQRLSESSRGSSPHCSRPARPGVPVPPRRRGAIVHVWGSARHAAVLDTRLNGNGIVDAGLVVRQPEGFVARRVIARSFRSYGVLVDPNRDDYRARAPYVLTDLNVSRVTRRVP